VALVLLIKGAVAYAPKSLGKVDVLLAGGKIELIGSSIEPPQGAEVVDACGMSLFPGFVDQHVHIVGGGGELGFASRAPEITAGKLIEAGITTVVGVLGTDGLTKSVESLVAKAKALRAEGIAAYAATGSYALPSATLTGGVMKDIVFISEIIGVKVAVSDSRSSSPSRGELARLASDARLAGMLSGKPGIVVAHMGNGKEGLSPITDVLESSDIPARVFRPTHVNRERKLCDQALAFAKKGGMIDLNPDGEGDLATAQVISRAKEQGVPLESVTVSSDGQGSWSRYDSRGNVVEMGVSSVACLYEDFVGLVGLGFPVEEALSFYTSNVARGLGLYGVKGSVSPGADADLILAGADLAIDSVILGGRMVFRHGEAVKRPAGF
jgi:beta-aspartyl-dipeptidase (metallo-type)